MPRIPHHRNFREDIQEELKHSKNPLSLLDLGKRLRIASSAVEHEMLKQALQSLVDQAIVHKHPRRKFSLTPPNGREGVGLISFRHGKAIVYISKPTQQEIQIQRQHTGNALDGDTVRVLIHARVIGKRRQGEVAEVITRSSQPITGTLEYDGSFYYLVPDDERYHVDFIVADANLNGAKAGEKVVGVFQQWSLRQASPEARIVEVLGNSGQAQVEFASIVKEFQLPASFPSPVEQEAQAWSEPTEVVPDGRLNLLGDTIVTIDPVDARDFDDALSFKTLSNGEVELGVHIADVSHYVQEGSHLDVEALRRGTSTYLVHKVVPMLPEHLSNNVCSLMPDVPRFAFSVIMRFSKTGVLKSHTISETLIRSSRRFTYEEVQDILDAHGASTIAPPADPGMQVIAQQAANHPLSSQAGEQALSQRGGYHVSSKTSSQQLAASARPVSKKRKSKSKDEKVLGTTATREVAPTPTSTSTAHAVDDRYVQLILQLHEFAQTLYSKRIQHGGIDFETQEIKYQLDDQLMPVGGSVKVRTDATSLVEECMLVANRVVAEHVEKLKKTWRLPEPPPMTYRIHEEPDVEKLADAVRVIRSLGVDVPSGKLTPMQLNAVLHAVSDKPERGVVSMLLLRSMAKAVYSEYNVGHFGLGFTAYTHFTSPIRRYPDLFVHRILKEYAKGKPSAARLHQLHDQAGLISDQCTVMERAAVEAERASVKLAQALIAQEHVGESFEGAVTGVTSFGVFVTIPKLLCEGLLHLKHLQDDYYYFDEQRLRLVGKSKRRILKYGSQLTVVIARVDLTKRMIDFTVPV